MKSYAIAQRSIHSCLPSIPPFPPRVTNFRSSMLSTDLAPVWIVDYG